MASLNTTQFADYTDNSAEVRCPQCDWRTQTPPHLVNYAKATHINTQHVELKGS